MEGMRGFWQAIGFLTALPVPARHRQTAPLALAIPWFPAVGALVGVVCGLAYLLGDRLAGPLGPLAAVTAWLVITRALHVDGFADTVEGFLGGATPERRLEIMKDSRIGVFGTVAIVWLISSKWATLSMLVMGRDPKTAIRVIGALALIYGAGRWVHLVLALCSRSARAGLGSAVVEQVHGRAVIVAAIPLVLLILALQLWKMSAVFPVAVGVALLSAWLAHRMIGGLTGDVFGFASELFEVVMLAYAGAFGV